MTGNEAAAAVGSPSRPAAVAGDLARDLSDDGTRLAAALAERVGPLAATPAPSSGPDGPGTQRKY